MPSSPDLRQKRLLLAKIRARAPTSLLDFYRYCWWMPHPLAVGCHTRAIEYFKTENLPAATDEDTAIGHFALFKDTVSPEEKAAILDYSRTTGETYNRWNAALRKDGINELPAKDRAGIESLTNILHRAPVFDGTSHRGTSFDGRGDMWQTIAGLNSGEAYPDTAFVSSSFSDRIPDKFMKKPFKVKTTIRGKSGVPLFSFADSKTEKEILFNHHKIFRVLSNRIKGDIVFLKLEEVTRD